LQLHPFLEKFQGELLVLFYGDIAWLLLCFPEADSEEKARELIRWIKVFVELEAA
jgi:hypothetical protein